MGKALAGLGRWHRQIGLIAAPVLCLSLWVIPIEGMGSEAHRLSGIMALMVCLWITEAIPPPVTALLGPALCVLTGVADIDRVFASFGDPIIFLLLGSFLLARAMLHHGLNRRIALHILGIHWIRGSPTRLMLAFGGSTAFISMWLSNSASTAMMFPVAVAILSEMARSQSQRDGMEMSYTQLPYSTGLMLLTAFAATVGGLATPVGTPPNLIGIGMIEEHLKVELPFFQWMAFGAPLSLLLLGFLVLYLSHTYRAEPQVLAQAARQVLDDRASAGPLQAGERNVLIAFGTTVFLWLLPAGVALIAGADSESYQWLRDHLPEAVVALIGAMLLFLLPINWREGRFTLAWSQAIHIDWGTILLFGGGLAMGELMFSTRLADWLGREVSAALGAHTILGVTVLFTFLAGLISSVASNTASASMVVPVAIAVAKAAGVDPLQPALGACLGASMGNMLPVSTAPNAIVYGSGCVPLPHMARAGLVLDLVGCLLTVGVVLWVFPWLKP